jgi:hypothetical protein
VISCESDEPAALTDHSAQPAADQSKTGLNTVGGSHQKRPRKLQALVSTSWGRKRNLKKLDSFEDQPCGVDASPKKELSDKVSIPGVIPGTISEKERKPEIKNQVQRVAGIKTGSSVELPLAIDQMMKSESDLNLAEALSISLLENPSVRLEDVDTLQDRSSNNYLASLDDEEAEWNSPIQIEHASSDVSSDKSMRSVVTAINDEDALAHILEKSVRNLWAKVEEGSIQNLGITEESRQDVDKEVSEKSSFDVGIISKTTAVTTSILHDDCQHRTTAPPSPKSFNQDLSVPPNVVGYYYLGTRLRKFHSKVAGYASESIQIISMVMTTMIFSSLILARCMEFRRNKWYLPLWKMERAGLHVSSLPSDVLSLLESFTFLMDFLLGSLMSHLDIALEMNGSNNMFPLLYEDFDVPLISDMDPWDLPFDPDQFSQVEKRRQLPGAF